MRIGIDATCWSNRRGYGRFTRGLIRALLEALSPHRFVLFVDAATRDCDDFPQDANTVVVKTSESPSRAASASSRRSIPDLLRMSSAVANSPLDAFFFPSVYSYFPIPTRAHVILGVHDVIAEDFPDLVFPWITERALWTLKSALAHRRANDIVTVSEHAKRGIVRRFGHSPDRIWVVDEAPDPLFRRLSDSEIDGKIRARLGLSPPERFIVYLGGMNPHKNLGSLLESLSVLERAGRLRGIKLVLVGETETELFTPGLLEVRERVTSLGLSRHVQFTGYLEEEDVVQLLNAADFLVLPSFAEGFGLPAVESAACGTPVIATTNSPLPELLKGGGLFVDPGKPQELTLALARMLSDHDERRRLGRMALKQAGRLTWQRSAGQFLARLEGLPRLS